MSKTTECVRQTDKKYQTRPSPPFPANQCCGEIMIGNDGGAYISVTNKNGICRWVPYNKPSFESRLLSPVLPPHSALPQRQILQQVEKKPAPRSVACHAMKAVDLKKILSDAQVAGRSKLTTKEAMCDEIMRLGLL